MKKYNRLKQIIKYIILSIGVFSFSVIISMITRILLVNDSSIFGFSENQASLIASMLEAIVGALSAGLVVYQLRSGDVVEERQNDIEEAKFILEYNQSFIQDEKMYSVEQQLEQEMLKLQKGESINHELITDDNRQQYINYLVYLEGLAPLVLRGVLLLEHIDDLMAYRFFLAMNNPTVQVDQIKEFPEYYRGCLKLYDVWKQYRKRNGKEILNEAYSIDKWEYFREFASNICIRGILPEDDTRCIAELIYKTDPYIDPTAFGSMKNAKKHLVRFMDIFNNPYYRDNIKIAVKNNEIVGILIVLSSPQTEPYRFESYASQYSDLPRQYMHTAQNYFNTLFEHLESENDVYISCVCVKEKYQRVHIGEILVMNTIRQYSDKNVHLHVLCENKGAIRLYEKCGFKKTEQVNGYSDCAEKPKCWEMTRARTPKEENIVI